MASLFFFQYHLVALLACATQFISQTQAFARHATVKSRELVDATNTYDFIVAGGGISGLTLADRLTENPEGMKTLKELLSWLSCRL